MSQESLQGGYLQYAGRWVATLRGKVIAQGGSPEQVTAAAQAGRHKETPKIEYIPLGRPLVFPPLLDRVTDALTGLPAPVLPVYLAGGAVRDAYLGKPVRDMDFVLQGDVLQIARKVADRIGAAYYPLDEERQTARLVLIEPGEPRDVLDFSAMRGSDLDSDLQARDFTINAMAVEITRPQELLDPSGGVADLKAKILRACSTHSFTDDPLRVLRGVRLAAAFGLHIHPETRDLMRAAAPGLAKVSEERRRDELFRILESARPSASIQALDLLGALRHLLPELEGLKDVEQSPPHISNVWKHSLDALQKLVNVIDVLLPGRTPDLANNLMMGMLVMQLGKFRPQMEEHLSKPLSSSRPLRSLLLLAALYHDIAKPQSKSMEEDGRIRFFGHDETGAQVVAKRARQLHMSTSEADRLNVIVRNHMRPFLLAHAETGPSRKAIYRFFKDTGEAGVDVCLVALADVLATYGSTLTAEVWTRHLEVTGKLLDAWWNRPEESVTPVVLLTGGELMDVLGVQPGPEIGRLLAEIREAQAEGEIKTREEALDLARRLSEKKAG